MTIEPICRDGKKRRDGFALRNTHIEHADRIDRLLLILVLVYPLLAALGRVANRRFCPSAGSSTDRLQDCRDFTIGRRMLEKAERPATPVPCRCGRTSPPLRAQLRVSQSRRCLMPGLTQDRIMTWFT